MLAHLKIQKYKYVQKSIKIKSKNTKTNTNINTTTKGTEYMGGPALVGGKIHTSATRFLDTNLPNWTRGQCPKPFQMNMYASPKKKGQAHTKF